MTVLPRPRPQLGMLRPCLLRLAAWTTLMSTPWGNDSLDDDTDVEEVDSYGSPFYEASPDDSEDADRDILWMPEGDMERAGRTAYALISEDGPIFSPAPFIYAAIFSVAPRTGFRMFPSSRGRMMVRFDSVAESDFIVDMSPIAHGGAQLSLERSEESPYRSVLHQPWLAAISATNFQDEHWTLTGIPTAFRRIGTVVEIDPACLEGDYSSLRVVVARKTASGIPDEEFVGNPAFGPGSSRWMGWAVSIPFFSPSPWPRQCGAGNGMGWSADPPVFGLVLHGSIVGQPGHGWGGPGYVTGFPYYFYQLLSPVPHPALIHLIWSLLSLAAAASSSSDRPPPLPSSPSRGMRMTPHLPHPTLRPPPPPAPWRPPPKPSRRGRRP